MEKHPRYDFMAFFGVGRYFNHLVPSAARNLLTKSGDISLQIPQDEARDWKGSQGSFFRILIYFLPVFLFLFSLPAVSAGNTFIFNPNTLSWKAINEHGQVVRTGRASGGRKYCPDIRRGCKTPSGVYRVWSKGGPGCRSSRYPVGRGGAPMPYCMYFSKNYAIHGSYEVPNYNASHGCVRLIPSDARWLSHNFIKIGTKVIIKPY